jgi:ketosteroid isomerase-like protein
MNTRDLVLGYLCSIETGDPAATLPFLHPDIVVVEHPNKLNPAGARYDLAGVQAAGARGAALLASQRYEVRHLFVDGDRAAAQTVWTATLKDGRSMRADIVSIIELRDGQVWRQEQYDCFPP